MHEFIAAMSRSVWYLLVEKGSKGFPSDLKGEVECAVNASIHQLRKLILEENKNTLGHVDAVKLEVFTHENSACSVDAELSTMSSGDKTKPFIIYYPPGTSIPFVPLIFHACPACTFIYWSSKPGAPQKMHT